MMTSDQENNMCPECGYNRKPNTNECPNCGISFTQIRLERKNEVIEKKQEDNLSEPPKQDISEVKLDLSFGSKRNILYNLNPRSINLFLFAVTAIIAGILVFKYILYLATHE